MAILKHIAIKNADYGEAQRYLMFQYNEDTMKPILDENGRLIPAKQWYRPEEKVLRASAVFRSPVKDVSSLWRAARFEIPK